MFCSQCGAPLEEDARFCVKCGAPVRTVQSDRRTENHQEEETLRKEETRRAQTTGREGKSSQSNRKKEGGPKEKSLLVPILIIFAVAIAAAAIILYIGLSGRGDSDKTKSEKTKAEASAEISKEDSNSARADKEKENSDSAETDKEEQEDSNFWKVLQGEEKEAEGPGSTAESSATETNTAEQSEESPGGQETVSDPVQTAEESAPVELPKDYDSLRKVLKDLTGAELNLVSSDVSDYPTVRLYFSYDDSAGEPITLTNPVAGIKESINGGAEIERTIRKIEQLEGNQGISIDIIADKSGSMSSDMDEMQEIMSEFVRSMDFSVGDKAELIAFDSYIMYMCTYTQDPALLQNGVYNMTAHGDTALYDAIAAGITNASYQQGARCVIAFTDGEDNRSVYTPEEIINMSLQKEVPVYIIGMGGAQSGTLTYICESTGGAYWNIRSINGMQQVMEEIYSHQKSMYCIEYESDKNADPYAERTVSCILSDDELNGTECRNTFKATEALKEQHHESRYELIKADVSWTEANDLCIAKGGHLVTITTPEEQKKIISMAEKAGLKYIWIGGYTSVRNNTAYGHWVTGEPFDYTAWYPGEPSRNDSMDNEPEFYIMLWNVEGEWSWNDQRNVLAGDPDLPWFAGNIGYVIEYEN